MAEFTIGAPIAYFTGLLALHSRCDNMYTQPCPCDAAVPCPSETDQCVHFGMGVKPRSIRSFLMAVALFVAGLVSQYSAINERVQQQLMAPGIVIHTFPFEKENIKWLH